MDLLRDGLLIAATLFAGGYCWVLSRRVKDLKSLDKGLGGSIVTLTRQIELARTTLTDARNATTEKHTELDALVEQARSEGVKLRQTLAATRNSEKTLQTIRSSLEDHGSLTLEIEKISGRIATIETAQAELAEKVVANGKLTAQLAATPAAPAPRPTLVETEPAAPDLPKPRALPAFSSPLRRRGSAALAPVNTEDDVVEALAALAAGGGN